jgi:DNA-binding NarL/FixJ family response regulator
VAAASPVVFPPKRDSDLLPQRSDGTKTREAALALSVDGFVLKAIADKLGISDRTVRSYLKQSGATAYDGGQDLPKAA